MHIYRFVSRGKGNERSGEKQRVTDAAPFLFPRAVTSAIVLCVQQNATDHTIREAFVGHFRSGKRNYVTWRDINKNILSYSLLFLAHSIVFLDALTFNNAASPSFSSHFGSSNRIQEVSSKIT